MDESNSKQTGKESQKALISLILAIISIIVIAASYPVSIIMKDIGIVDFMSLAGIFAIAAIILSVVVKISSKDKAVKHRLATSGLVIGVVSLVIIILIRIAIFIAFIPMLGQ